MQDFLFGGKVSCFFFFFRSLRGCLSVEGGTYQDTLPLPDVIVKQARQTDVRGIISPCMIYFVVNFFSSHN